MLETINEKIYLTQMQVAEHFCTSESTIKNWRDRGYLPYFQLPDSTRVLYPIEGIREVEQQFTHPAKGVVKGHKRLGINRKRPEISATTNKKWGI